MATSDHPTQETPNLSVKRAQLLASLKTPSSPRLAIPKRSDNGPAVLSPAQLRLFFLDQLYPDNPAYNLPLAFELKGHLNIAALQKAFDQVVARHEILRTSIVMDGDIPRQIIAQAARYPIETTSIDMHGPTGAREEVHQFVQNAVLLPFNLKELPLLRLTLLQFSNDCHVLVLVIHHIIWDAWSTGLFLSELAEGYRAALEGRPPHYPELSVQYADYAEWQTRWLEHMDAEKQLEHWKTQLRSASLTLDLPFDRQVPEEPSFGGSELPLNITQEINKAVTQLCKEEQTTGFVVFAAALGTWLHRYGQSDEILIGFPAGNRGRREIERSIGLFVNTLVLKCDLSGNPSFRSVVRRVRQTALEALSNQEIPFERVVQSLDLPRDRTKNPIFQAMLSFNGSGVTKSSELRLPELIVSEVDLLQNTAMLDLRLRVDAHEGTYVGRLEYSTDRFSAEMGARLGAHFENILTYVTAYPDSTLSGATMLTTEETDSIVHARNNTFVDFGGHKTLHDLVFTRATRTPYSPACIYEGSVLSYEELERASDSIARQLRANDVGPDVIVGIAARRSMELMIGILGILKSGGAYLPLDPDLPLGRLRFMADDCKVPVILVQTDLVNLFSQMNARVITLDKATVDGSAEVGITRVEPANLAYVLFTSGSTGMPKACMNTHEGICNRLQWMQNTFHLGAVDRVLQKTPFSFDVSAWELFWPLITGAAVVFARPQAHGDPLYIAEAIRTYEITTVHFVPSMLERFLDVVDSTQCASLRRVISSGEALSPSQVERFFAMFPNVQLYNLYGPTEAAIDVTAWRCEATKRSSTPIGYPIANLQTYVLDRELRPLPLGVPGELYLGGVGVGRGYWNRPDLTADRFVPDPFSQAHGSRLYRTGDLARWSPDGPLEFLERLDGQIKFNGNRIELGEVETCLRQEESVLDAIVIPVTVNGKLSHLAAYVIPRDSLAPDALRTELRSRLRSRLPAYMIPSQFVFLSKFPLTTSGKLDRKALPTPETEARPIGAPYFPPTTPLQEVLATMWATQLGIDRVGISDNFFELGGDSIQSLKLVATAERAGLRFTVQQMFTFQTIRELTAAMESNCKSVELPTLEDEVAGIDPKAPHQRYRVADFPLAGLDDTSLNNLLASYSEVEDLLPLVSLQDDLFSQYLASSDPALGMVQKVTLMTGPLNIEAFDRALQELAQRQQVARTSFVWKGLPHPLQVIHKSTRLPVGYLDWRSISAKEQTSRLNDLLDTDARRGLELDVPTPIRTVFIHIADDIHWMVMSFNYMCLEGWSLSLLQREQKDILDALQRGEKPSKRTRPSYRGYIRWLQNHNFQEAEEFWKQQLKDSVLPTPLVGRLGPGVPRSKRFEREDRSLSGELTSALRSLARTVRRTENSVYQSAWALVVSYYSGLDDVVLGIAVTGRSCDFPDIQNLVGYAMNYIPLRLQISRDMTFISWLGEVQSRQTAILRFEHTPPKKVRAWCGLPADQLVFESIFYFQNADAPTFGETVGRFYARTAYPLRVDVIPQTEDIGTQIFASYHERYFNLATIQRLLDIYVVTLEAIARDRSQTLGSLLTIIEIAASRPHLEGA